jgi:hypothetical protein
VLALGAVVALGACRAAVPASGPGFDAARVAPPSRLPRVAEGVRWLDVDDRDLEGLRDAMRRSLAAGANGLTNELTWGFEGRTESFDTNLGISTEVSAPRTLARELAESATLDAQLEGLLSDPTLRGLLTSGVDRIGFPSSRRFAGFPPSLPTEAECGDGGDDDASETFSRLDLRLDPAAIALRWEPTDLADQPALRAVPVLGVELPFDIDLRFVRRSFLDLVLRLRQARTRFVARIQPRVCRDGALTALLGEGPDARVSVGCSVDGTTLLVDAQRFLPGPDGPDLEAPRQGLELAVAGAGSSSVSFEPSASCVPSIGYTLATQGAALGAFLGTLVPGVGTAFGTAFGGFIGFILSPLVCDLIAGEASRRVSQGVSCALRSVEQLASIAVNPPTLRPSLRTVLLATGADTSGDGTLSSAELQTALRPFLGEGADLAAAAALLGPVIDRVEVAIGAEGVIEVAGVERRVPFSTAEGALRDGAYTTIARGGRVELRTVLPDFRRLIRGCTSTPEGERDRELGRFCTLCALGGCVPGDRGASPDSACYLPCVGGVARDASGALAPSPVPEGTAGATLTIPVPAPTIATLPSGAPLFAEELRDYFARPLPSFGRYVRTAVRNASGRRVVSLGYVDDPDGDWIDLLFDNCPDVSNPDQADDGDGDTLGAACDLCPGVRSDDRGNADPDGDGLGAACDCDADADGCFNRATPLGGGACPVPGAGRTLDRNPLRAGTSDLDRDGIPDDCDADSDGDGVKDEADSCPFGDGDDLFEPGVDDVHDETDSGGIAAGDLCDPLCGPSGPPVCRAPVEGLGGFERFFPGRFGRFECIGGGCQVGAFVDCLGNQVDRCTRAGFDRLRLTDGLGRGQGSLDAAALGLGAGFGERLVGVGDLDGDRVSDWAVGLPGARTFGCGGQQGCPGAGAVAIVSGRTLAPLAVLAGDEAGAGLGAALAFDGRYLAVGAPGAQVRGAATGSVRLYEVALDPAALVARYDGAAALEALGSDVVAVPGRGFVVGAPGAEHGRGRLTVLDARGVLASWAGPAPGAGLSRAVVLEGQDGATVAAAARLPGTSAVIRYDLAGRERARTTAPDTDGLGAALLATQDGELLATAPGALGGRGAVLRLEADGGTTLLAAGYLGLGTTLSEATGAGLDVAREIYVGTADYGGPGTLSLRRARPLPPGGGGDPL